MGKQRDIADSAAVINYLDGTTSSVQTQLDAKAKYDDTTANFTGTLQNGGSNVVVDSDIGSTVQAYDADTAKYDDTTANFTGTLQNGDANVVVDTDIGSTVQAYDSNLTSFVSAFTLPTSDGTADQVLTTNGSGTLSFADASGGGTLGTLTKTFTANETATITLTDSVLTPVVSVTKEIAQTDLTNNSWDVNSTTENYTRVNSAPATTLDFVAFDISTASYSQNFSVASQETVPQDIAFNTNGTKMFIVGSDGDDVNEYTLSTGFDVSTATYSQNFSVSGQETNPTGIAFNTDGTKMFIIGSIGQDVNEYTLSTGFDVSTATYSQNFSVSAQETDPRGIAFNTDGTKMFIVGATGDDVNEYTLGTGFDVSTASYSQNFSVASQDTSPQGIAFNTNGTKMFILGATGDAVNEYTLGTAFDVSTASYSQNFSVSGQDTAPLGMAFNTDGRKMFIVGNLLDVVFEYTISLVLQLSTGSFASTDVGKTIYANSGEFILTATGGSCVETTVPTSYDQVASGSWEMYAIVYNSSDDDLELSGYTNGFDVSTATYSHKFFIEPEESSAEGIAFNTNGTKMFIVGSTGDAVYEYTLGTAFDLSTASYSQNFSVSAQETAPRDIAFNANGTKMFILGDTGNDVNEYTLSTGFDVSTASYSQNFSVALQETDPYGIAFNTDGTKMFILGWSSDAVNEYDLSTGFDVSTASYSQNFSVSSQETTPLGMTFNTDGTKMYIVGFAGNDVNEYDLSTGFDVSTASFVDSFSFGNFVADGIRFNANGTKMFLVGYISAGTVTGDHVYEYNIGPTAILGYHAAHTTTSIDSTYWADINSMTADQAVGDGSIYYAVSTDDRTTWSIVDNTDGIRDIVRNNAGTWQYNSTGTYGSETWTNGTTNTELATLAEAMEGAINIINPFDISTASFSKRFSLHEEDFNPTGIAFNTNGTKMFILGYFGDDVNEYDLSTGFDVSTASYSQNFSVASEDTSPRGLAFNNDGTKMFVTGTIGDDVNEYTLSTGFDVSTASYSQRFSVSARELTPTGIAFNTNGTKMFIVGTSSDAVNEYTLSTAFNVSTASYSQNFSVSSQDTIPTGIAFNTDGTKMFITGDTGNAVYEYTLSTGFDVSTASYSQNFSIAGEETSPYGIVFNTNGTKMFIVGTNKRSVNEYTIGTSTYINQMDKTQLEAVTDANHFTLGNDLDLAIIFNLSSGTTVPSSDGVSINYDGNVLNKGAILGTDYDFDAPAQNKVRVTALANNNLKIRVV